LVLAGAVMGDAGLSSPTGDLSMAAADSGRAAAPKAKQPAGIQRVAHRACHQRTL